MAIPTDTDDSEGFVARWSRRKQLAGESVAEENSTDNKMVEPEEEASAAPVLTDADMPDIDSLDENSDYSVFMSPGVSQQLRARALKQLFHTPGLSVPDGLDDYDEDFTQLPKLGSVITREMRRLLDRQSAQAQSSDKAPLPAEADAGKVETAADTGLAQTGSGAVDEATDADTTPEKDA